MASCGCAWRRAPPSRTPGRSSTTSPSPPWTRSPSPAQAAVTASNLQADRLAVDIGGAGHITLAGTVDSQVVTISGTGNYDGENLQSATADVTVDGAAKAVVRVSTRLNATVDGVGSIQYIGNPQVARKINGVGSVKPR